ncbi:MAG TPA: hypothetical protein VK541_17465 [Pedobacter sp.]|uniref:hypothetical protein n=1 Tax=Pedobacter sp. TaxID=1411316 RepID=UPI002CD93477|nr:hypothetical protein [Pedobacter sp.]HMI04281.1 hypothetical protein [Pedobacter sp.]
MSFKKIILEVPAEGFAGDTIKHIITKANLKNQPEEAAKYGWKEGDEITVVKPVADAPIVGKSAATKTKSTSPTKEVKVNENPNDEKVLSIAKGNKKAAEGIATAQNVDVVFENDKEEFFTSENLARLSVGNDKSKIIVHTF